MSHNLGHCVRSYEHLDAYTLDHITEKTPHHIQIRIKMMSIIRRHIPSIDSSHIASLCMISIPVWYCRFGIVRLEYAYSYAESFLAPWLHDVLHRVGSRWRYAEKAADSDNAH